MSYTITARVFQTNPNTYFRIVEKTVFSSGNWSETNDQQVLFMTGSGTSGTLRFLADNGENFIVALGVHNYKRWTDIVTNLDNNQTGVVINPQYYSQADRQAQREKQLATYGVKNAKGRQFTVNFIVTDGNALVCNIIIG